MRLGMSILSRYLLRVHVVPFVFALSALTSVMLLNQIARRLKDLIGKGLPWSVIVEVFALSIPFIVAMTLPMAVLVTVLYTMSRLTADNEITALRASGISLHHIARPLLVAGLFVVGVSFLFSDQVLPRSNHRLRTLLTDITRTKPSFAIDDQVINEVKRGQIFLRAGRIDRSTYLMRDVSIYDVGDNNRKRVTYADSAYMAFDPNGEDLYLTLFDGTMHESDRANDDAFQLVEFRQDRVRVEGVANTFDRTLTDSFKGDREMGVCEMDSVITMARKEIIRASAEARAVERNSLRGLVGLASLPFSPPEPQFEERAYCRWWDQAMALIRRDTMPEQSDAIETVGEDTELIPIGEAAADATQETDRVPPSLGSTSRIHSARVLWDRVRSGRIREANYLVEVHKKYAIAVASIIFVLVGIPAALRFPRGGVGLVIGFSLVVFSIYYVGLIAGESVANRLIIPPFWSMWTPNVVFAVIGVITLWRARTTSSTARGGSVLDRFTTAFRRAAS